MRVLFTGGGTGGHIFPNIAIIRRMMGAAVLHARSSLAHNTAAPIKGGRSLKKSPKNAHAKSQAVGAHVCASDERACTCAPTKPLAYYIGAKNSMEQELMRKEGVPFFGIHTGKLRRYFDLQNIIDAFEVPLGTLEALFILRRLKPDVVFSKGGYVGVPVCLAAKMLGIPVWLHESDATPGLSTKICSRFAQNFFCAFEESRAYFPDKKVEVLGNPVRQEILEGKKSEGYRITGFSSELPVILIMGGSLGAHAINKLAAEILPQLLQQAQIVHITGSGTFPLFACPLNLKPRYRHFPFLGEELPHIYAIADLVVSRAGASGIFELLALRKPMLLIPLPKSASRGDQLDNAAIFEKKGFAQVLDQDSLTPEKLLKTLQNLLGDKKQRSTMEARQEKYSFNNAAEVIAKKLIEAHVRVAIF